MARNYNYTKLTCGKDYTFEVANDNLTGDMIGQGNLKVGDCIIISSKKYQVVEVEYYLEPPDMWRAKVSLLTQNSP